MKSLKYIRGILSYISTKEQSNEYIIDYTGLPVL